MTTAPVSSPTEAFKTAFTRFAATVSVITYAGADGEPAGMTATAMCSLSLSPLSLLVCVNRENRSHGEIVQSGRFGVNMLAAGQQNVANHCSRPGSDKRIPTSWLRPDPDGVAPIIDGAVAHIGCELAQAHDAHTHSIFVGHVSHVWLGPDAPPLLYCNRSYRRFDDIGDDEAMQRVWDRVAFGSLS
jgi:flavin reductase (NADH)/cob(II)yrinic acid a,c-diamide reductase